MISQRSRASAERARAERRPSERRAVRQSSNGQKRSGQLLAVLDTYSEAILVSHINPDPDSLASMMGLAHLIDQKLNIRATMTLDGVISRAENRAMVQL